MPSYEKRGDELEAHLRADATIPAGEAGTLLSKLVSGLLDSRDQALTAMLAVLTTDGNELLADDYKEKAQLATDRWIDPLSKILDGMTNPSPQANSWREVEAACESKFFTSLAALKLGEARDELVALEAALEKETKDLQLKWDTMSEEAKRTEAIEAEASQKMTGIVQQAMSDGVAAWARYGEAARQLGESLGKIPGLANETMVYLAKEAGWPDKLAEFIPKLGSIGKDYYAKGQELGISPKDLAAANPELIRDPGLAISQGWQKMFGGEVEMYIKAAILAYQTLTPIAQRAYKDQLGNYQRTLPNQGVICVSLGQTRRDVDAFLKNNGLEKARAVFERVQTGLSNWADGQITDGQKSDAAAWEKDAIEPFKKRYERISNALGVFVQNNQGRFIGAPSKATEDALIFTEVWADREQGLIDVGMDARIREWRASLVTVTDTVATASSQAFAELRHLPSDVSDKIFNAMNDYWSKVREQIEREKTAAIETMTQAAAAVEPAQIKRDLDRRPLQAQLTA